MKKEEFKKLLNIDTKPFSENRITIEMLSELDAYLTNLENYKNIGEDAFSVYKKFVSMKQEAPDSMKNNLFSVLKKFIHEKKETNEFYSALFLYRFLIVKSKLSPEDYFNIAEILFNIGDRNLLLKFIKIYEEKETNKPLLFITLANFYNLQMRDYKTAIRYYEKYIEIDKTKPVVYTIVGSLYAKEYGDLSLKDQIFYFKKAYTLKPSDRLNLHGLAYGYEKLGDKENADKYYKKLLDNNPTETDYYNYGAFLINCGDFQNGHKYFAHRFNIDDNNLKYPLANDIKHKWDFKADISDKTLLVHYEQGFGDTFMYCRFVPFLKKLAGKIIFVVQDDLFDLLKSSPIFSDGIEIVPESIDISTLQYDFHMALLDAPLALNTDISTIPYKNGYLEVDRHKIDKYAKKYLKKSENLKVGIAYSGDKSANYNGRDIELNRFRNLLNIEGIDFYSLQVNGEDESLYNITSLGNTFKSFTDTACAMKNMDIIISTDNVILNLAGALGITTYGLFNKFPNYRWYKLNGKDVGWYSSVIPLQAEETNCWRDIFAELIQIMLQNAKELAKK